MIRYRLARLVMNYHISTFGPRWVKHSRLYRCVWNWSFSTLMKREFT